MHAHPINYRYITNLADKSSMNRLRDKNPVIDVALYVLQSCWHPSPN
jgi:hypothetical protein